MKLAHKVNGWSPDRTDPDWAAKVEREAAITTDRAEVAYRRAVANHDRARKKAEREQAKPKPNRKHLAGLWRKVEQRLAEVRALEYQMKESPAGSQHRGTPAYRGVATGRP